jgi:HK97 family phage major capsid protein
MSEQSTQTPPKVSKGTKAALMKRMNVVAAKLNLQAPLLEKASKQPDHGGRFTPLTWNINGGKGVPSGAPNYTRQLGEKHYSFTNVALMALGEKDPDDCPEEVQISQKLAEMYQGVSFKHGHSKKSWLIPMSTSYLPQRNDKEKSFCKELVQKIYMRPVDPGEVNFLQSKGWSMNREDYEFVTKNLGTTTDTAGGTFVNPPQIIELLEMQYKLEAWSRAGATQIPMMPNGRALISKINQGTTAFYADEGVNFQAQLSQAVTGQLILVAKKVAVLTAINNELLRFGMPATETMVRYDMARQAALFADGEMFAGTGGTHIAGLLSPAYPSQNPPWTQGVDAWLSYANAPTAASTPVGPTGLGTNGNVFNPDDTDKMANTLPDEITPDEVTFLMTRSLFGGVQSRRAAAIASGDNQGVYVAQRLVGLTPGMDRNKVEGYPTVWSSNVPTNRSKGTSSNLTMAIVGRFPDWVIARLGVGEIVSNSFDSVSWYGDSTSLRLIQQIDAGARYVASFCVYDQLLNG